MTDQQKTAEPCGDAVCQASKGGNNRAGWTDCTNKANGYYKTTLTKSGKIALCGVHAKNYEPVVAPQPAAPTQIDAGELEAALEYLNNPTFDDECEEWGRCWLIVEAAARAHLSKLSEGV